MPVETPEKNVPDSGQYVGYCRYKLGKANISFFYVGLHVKFCVVVVNIWFL